MSTLKEKFAGAEVPTMELVAKVSKGLPQTSAGRLAKDADLNERFRLAPQVGASRDDLKALATLPGAEPLKVPHLKRTDYLVDQLVIFFPFSEVNRLWDAQISLFTALGQVMRSDGEYLTYLRWHPSVGGDDRLLISDGYVVEDHTDEFGRKWEVGERRPFVREATFLKDKDGNPVDGTMSAYLNAMVPGFGLKHFRVKTHAWNDVYNFPRQLVAIQVTLAAAGQKLAGVPLMLTRKPHEVSLRFNGKRSRAIRYLWNVSLEPSWVADRFPALSGNVPELLPLGQTTVEEPEVDVPADEDDIVDAEYVPVDETFPPVAQPDYAERRNPPVSAEPAQTSGTWAPPEWASTALEMVGKKVHADPTSYFYGLTRLVLNLTNSQAADILSEAGSAVAGIEYVKSRVETASVERGA